jgi:glutamate dehydrogenase
MKSMTDSHEKLRKEVINKLSKYIQKKLPRKKAKQLVALVPQYYRTIPLEDINTRSIEDLYGTILTHFGLMEQRAPKECKLRVYNPNLEQDGWQSTHTIVQLSYDDMPFLVDSLRMEINREGYTIHLVVSSGGIKVRRDKHGKLLEVLPPEATGKDVITEAITHMEIDRETDLEVLENIRKNLLRVLQDVTVVVADWKRMREELVKVLAEVDKFDNTVPSLTHEEIEESKSFLRWLMDDHFTFLGYRAYKTIGEGDKRALQLISNTGLGVLRDEKTSKVIRYFNELPPKALKLVTSPNVLIISKTNTRSTVHRSGYTDYIGVKLYDKAGNIIGERRFIGLYTSEAYISDPYQIPILRHKVKQMLEKSNLPPVSHSARTLRNILATLPRDDLFQASVDDLYELAIGILHLQERRRIRLFILKDTYQRYVSCLVYVPRESFNTEVLYRMRDILMEALGGREVTFTTHFSESILARIHLAMRVDPKKPLSYDVEKIENKLVKVGRSWYDSLQDNLIEHF